MDCEDPQCQVSSPITADQVAEYNCLGSDQLGNETREWYCMAARNDPDVGLCCEDGAYPLLVAGTWDCVLTNPCEPDGSHSCDFNYSNIGEFSSWITSDTVDPFVDPDWCVYPSAGRACCPVVHFASDEYWDDATTGNVRIY